MNQEKLNKEVAKFKTNPEAYIKTRPVKLKLWEFVVTTLVALGLGVLVGVNFL